MHILITGAAGMIGRKLTQALLKEGRLGGNAISRLTLHDVIMPDTAPNAPFQIVSIGSDLSARYEVRALLRVKPDIIFHLAAVVSGEAEDDFDKGYRVNLTGTWHLFEEVRTIQKQTAAYRPRLVFASSTGVFGGPYTERIEDDFISAPLTSYGTQKAMAELLLSDYTRKGFFDGIGIRIPTICVRPGKPNKAASGFFSSIIREPLVGLEAVLPVSEDVRHWHASPRSAVGFLTHAATIDGDAVGSRRTLSMPGVSCTVAEQIEALRRVAGADMVRRIRHASDEKISRMVAGWPRNFNAKRATDLGFKAETNFEEIIRVHIEDELSDARATVA
ncbi:nucleoside-diphosphate-sugar epimerase [Bradyrhizobium sp. S3.12.5]|uniref:D-erythronate dehydrogenase n=1 Tax=Bradyrhizobium sp. S3.12.5 TaxID=3156386 RepID=UPI0033942AC2